MISVLTGQLILGIDKRNPLFTVYAEEDPEQLHVYDGLELLEIVSADRNDPSFKMLVGRLYNAGLSRRVLQETFQVDLKTIQRWGRALRCRDAQELVRLLSGCRARKRTAEIEAYVRARWPELSRLSSYGISKRLRQEIESVFGIKLCQETLRPLLGKLKRGEGLAGAIPLAQGPRTTADRLPQPGEGAVENQELGSEPEETPGGCSTASSPELTEAGADHSASVPVLESAPRTLWCDHAGVLLFAPSWLSRLIEENRVRMDPDKKRLMDRLRVIARNVCYAALAPFKKASNNYRDDHDQFRQWTQASGVLEVGPPQIVVHLLPRVNFSPQLRRIIGGVLEALNEKQPVLPEGSGRRLTFRLANRAEMKLSMERGA